MRYLILALVLVGCATRPRHDFNKERIETTQIRDNNVILINEQFDAKLKPNPRGDDTIAMHNEIVELRRAQKMADMNAHYEKIMRMIDESEMGERNIREAEAQAWSNFGNRLNQISTQNQLSNIQRTQQNQNHQLQQIKNKQNQNQTGIIMRDQ